jgi:hypothetical protein
MEWYEIANLAPSKLATLLDVEHEIVWSEPDSTNILRRQLDASLWPDLSYVKGIAADHLQRLVRERPPGETFRQHLLSSRPCVELLFAIKAFAQQVRSDSSNPLHGNAAGILYFLAIAAGLTACNKRLTSLSKRQLEEGFDWVVAQPGAPELKELAVAAIDYLHCRGNQIDEQ